MNTLAEKVAWVTGGARGIGAAIATELRGLGAKVFVTDREEQGSVESCDIRNSRLLAEYANSVVRRAGRLDILVNNAGVQLRRAFTDLLEEDYDTIINTNVRGTFFAAQATARTMVAAGRPGAIVNVCSVNAERGRPDTVLYCASKGAVRAMTKALAISLGRYGIRVNSVAPGTIATDFNRDRLSDAGTVEQNVARIVLGRLGVPQDVAPAVGFLVSDDAAYITGATIGVHGGWTLMGP